MHEILAEYQKLDAKAREYSGLEHERGRGINTDLDDAELDEPPFGCQLSYAGMSVQRFAV